MSVVFDLTPNVKTVQIRRETNGKVETLTLKEASEKIVVAWRNERFSDIRVENESVVAGIDKSYSARVTLLSGCLFNGENPVPKSEIENWPTRTIEGLYDLVIEMSDLKTEDEDEDTVEKVDAKIKELTKKKLELMAKGDAEKK